MPRLNEESYRFWDLVLKAGSAIGFILAALFSYSQYLDTATRDARKPFLEKQLELCVEASDSAAMIATSPRPSDVKASKVRFDRLYWGSLAIFDNKRIAHAMKEFNSVVTAHWSGGDLASNERAREALRPLSEEIAHECRDLVIASWFGSDPGMLSRTGNGSVGGVGAQR